MRACLTSALSAWLAGSTAVIAQVPFTGAHAENFNSLPLVGTNPAWTDNGTLPGWYAVMRGSGGAYTAPANFVVRNFIPPNAVGTPGFVLSDCGLDGTTAVRADRSFGTLATSANATVAQPVAFALRLRNDTGAAITSLAITFTGKQWTQGYSTVSTNHALNFAYSTDATALSNGTFTSAPALDFIGPVASQTTTPGSSVSLNGNSASNQVAFNAVSFTIAGGWAAGADLWLRWSQVQAGTTATRMSALAIDDVVVSSGVAGAPIVNVQPVSRELPEPLDTSFTVSAVGTPPLAYQWFKDGAPIPGATSNTLTITQASLEAALQPVANYFARVTNSVASTDSVTATLTVHKLPGYPQISTHPLTTNAVAGGGASLSVAHGGVAPFTYQWRRNLVNIPGATNATLAFPGAQFADTGYYDVVITNARDTVISYSAPLYVNGFLQPVIHKQPAAVSLGVNGAGGMRVIATGRPDPAFQWRKNGAPIPGANTSILHFKNTQLADAGTYDVVLTNVAGTLTSAPVALTVGVLPAATVRVVDQRGGTPYPTIASAVVLTQPGDVIELASGSGPYRETAVIPQSGTAQRPIVFEGNGELITGFIPFEFGPTQPDGTRHFTLPVSTNPPQPLGGTTSNNSTKFRYLIAHHDTRIRADAVNGSQANVRLTSKYVSLSADGLTLILAPGAPADGWQIGGYLELGVSTGGTSSWQTFRNLRVSGTSGDCFNMHGTGIGQVFENIVGFNGFDEGFSAHDGTRTEAYRAVFFNCENGIGNDGRIPCQFTGDRILAFSNLGFGFQQRGGIGETLTNIESWDNGIQNLNLGGPLLLYNVVSAKHRWTNKPWLSFQETADLDLGNTSVVYANAELQFFNPTPALYATYNPVSLVGQYPVIREVAELPALLVDYDNWTLLRFTHAENTNAAITGPLADPDGDGLGNLLEYAFDLPPKSPGAASLMPAVIGGYLAVSYRVRSINTDITAFAEGGANLSVWSSDPLDLEETLPPDHASDFGFETVQARDLTSTSSSSARFIRLRVSKP